MKYFTGLSTRTCLRLLRLLNAESDTAGIHTSARTAGEVAVDCGLINAVPGSDDGNPSFLTTLRFRTLLELAADVFDCIKTAGISWDGSVALTRWDLDCLAPLDTGCKKCDSLDCSKDRAESVALNGNMALKGRPLARLTPSDGGRADLNTCGCNKVPASSSNGNEVSALD